MKLAVASFEEQEFLVGPFLNNPSFFHNTDPVGVSDGGEPVGDDHGGAVFHQVFDGLLDLDFGLGIEGGGGLIKDEDGRVLDQGTGNRETLSLTA